MGVKIKLERFSSSVLCDGTCYTYFILNCPYNQIDRVYFFYPENKNTMDVKIKFQNSLGSCFHVAYLLRSNYKLTGIKNFVIEELKRLQDSGIDSFSVIY